MRPVNLIPGDGKQRRERADTGVAPHAVVATLAAGVLALLGYVVVQNQINSRKSDLANLEQRVDETTAKAAALALYARFESLKQARLTGISTIAGARFPWPRVLKQISLAIPDDAWLVKVVGKASQTAKVGETVGTGGQGGSGGGGGGGGAGGDSEDAPISVPVPSIQVVGCTYSQHQVARMMVRMRNVENVAKVLLKSSSRKDADEQATAAGPGAGAGTISGGSAQKGECRVDSKNRITKFNVTMVFKPHPATDLIAALSPGTSSSGSAKSPTGKAQGAAAQANSASAKASTP